MGSKCGLPPCSRTLYEPSNFSNLIGKRSVAFCFLSLPPPLNHTALCFVVTFTYTDLLTALSFVWERCAVQCHFRAAYLTFRRIPRTKCSCLRSVLRVELWVSPVQVRMDTWVLIQAAVEVLYRKAVNEAVWVRVEEATANSKLAADCHCPTDTALTLLFNSNCLIKGNLNSYHGCLVTSG